MDLSLLNQWSAEQGWSQILPALKNSTKLTLNTGASLPNQNRKKEKWKGYKKVFSSFQMKNKNIFKLFLARIHDSRWFLVNKHNDFDVLGGAYQCTDPQSICSL